ncbi:BACON domain-containing carbohydrate-binding protein [uncultured Muribaculum sp.]|uniref:BACON domain-containing protein n=1 Tax=uncultured Muribaculum sp. TaxID=1918613 RepID=UPI0025E12EED|nr:BACON domain-containing carbohydrate-binding protein [uncultured Muribaculum sp.]
MKPLRYILCLAAAMLSAGFLTSCSDDDETPDETPALSLIASTGNNFSGSGGTLEILVRSNVDYDVEIDADWITRVVSRAVPTLGSETFIIAPYPLAADKTPRKATIKITATGMEDQCHTVEQVPAELFRFDILTIDGTPVPAEGGEVTVNIDTNTDYTVEVSDNAWISTAPATDHGIARFSIAGNTAVEARTGKITFKPVGMDATTVEFTQEGARAKGISDADDFIAFASAVNSGQPLDRWTDENGEITLLADINLSGKQWIPAGNLKGSKLNATAATLGDEGYPFTGIFNGNGHTISALSLTADDTPCYGLFGTCSNATIKNLVIDASCTMQITNENMTAGSMYGFAAGVLHSSTMDNVTVKGTVLESLINKGSSNFLGSLGGVVGYAYCSTIKGCTFAGSIVRVKSNMYHNSLGTGVAGVVGYAWGTPTQPSVVEGCTNSGDIYAQANRVAGVLGQSSGNFILRDCTNSGTIHADAGEATNAGWKSGLRVGGILGASTNSKAANTALLERCANSGTVVTDADAATYTGGVLGLVRTLTLTDISNTGCVIATEGSILGLVCGQLQCADKPTVNSCRAAGSIARSYTGSGSSIRPVDAVTVTANNYFQYAAGNVTGTNSGIWTTDNVKF